MKRKIISKLEDLFLDEHGCCDENTCDMGIAFNEGYSLWAISIYASSGAASSEFLKLYDSLPKKEFMAAAEKQRKKFITKVPNVECHECNSIVYHLNSLYVNRLYDDIYCSSCRATFEPTQLSLTRGAK